MSLVLTAEQKLSRWEDTREIKNLGGRMSTDYVLKESAICWPGTGAPGRTSAWG